MKFLVAYFCVFCRVLSGIIFLCFLSLTNVVAQQTTTSESAASVAEMEKTLKIAPLECQQDEISFDCVTDYIDSVKDGLPGFVEANLNTIKEKLEDAENAKEDWDELVRTANGVAEMAREGGGFSKEVDRIGSLIQKKRDEVINNPTTADLAPLFDAEFVRWERVRSQLLDVREQAQDVAELLEAGRDRGAALMSLSRIRDAINAADESVQGMSKIVEALQNVADETTRSPEELLGSD